MKKYLLAGIITLGLFIGVLAIRVVTITPKIAEGSVDFQGGGYYSTTTVDSTWPSATTYKVLRTGKGIFGSIVIGSTSPATANIYSMKCYDSSVSTTTATSTLAVIGSASAANTYTFDTSFNAGLICETPTGFNGGYTITWK